MNRRSIFKLIARAVCAAAMYITGLKPAMPRAAIAVVNPAYYTAAFEDVFILGQVDPQVWRVNRLASPESKASADLTLPEGVTVLGNPEILDAFPSNVLKVPDHHMTRYIFVNGQYIQVPQHILQA